MGLNPRFWKGKRVFITGHTGFKGAWFSLWLKTLGARVTGFSLKPSDQPNLFTLLNLKKGINSHIGDIRNQAHLTRIMKTAKPDIVFHLAAQALVRPSYADPIGTYATNIMGTAHVMEAVRQCKSVKVVVNVTSDKCYENDGRKKGYTEMDSLGGFDPYSSSKGGAELVGAAYRRSFFTNGTRRPRVALASARAGNVIGGGDWARDRLIPDLIRSVTGRKTVDIRYPDATRPWQFVLEPLLGYLLLAEKLRKQGASYAQSWNFGPMPTGSLPVRWILKEASRHLQGRLRIRIRRNTRLHEARALTLNSTKARRRLGWRSCLSTKEAVDWTLAWYEEYLKGSRSLRQFTEDQIAAYQKRVARS